MTRETDYNIDYTDANLNDYERITNWIQMNSPSEIIYFKELGKKLEEKIGKSLKNKKISFDKKKGNGFEVARNGKNPHRIVFSVIADRKDFENEKDFMNTILKILIKNKHIMVIRRIFSRSRTEYNGQFFIIIEDWPVDNSTFITLKKFYETLLSDDLKLDVASMIDSVYERDENWRITGKFYVTLPEELPEEREEFDNQVFDYIGNTINDIVQSSNKINFVNLAMEVFNSLPDNKQVYDFEFTFSIDEIPDISKKEIETARKKMEEQNKGESIRAKANVAKQNKRTKNIQCHNDIEFILQENIEDFDPTELTQLTLNKKIYCFENSSFVNMIKYAKDQKVRGDCKPQVDGKPLECKWFYPINIGFNVFIDSDNYDNLLKNNDKRLFEFKNKRVIDFTTGLHIMSEKSGKDNVYDIVTVSQKGGKVLNRRKKYMVVMKKNKVVIKVTKKPVKKLMKKPVKKVTKKPVKKVTKKPVKKVTKKPVKKVTKKVTKKPVNK